MEVSVTRQKHDVGWGHCQMLKEGDKEHIKCLYCGKIFKGGGIHRFKEHLAGYKGGGPMCLQVPQEVRLMMQQSLALLVGKKKKRKKRVREEVNELSSPQVEVDMSGSLSDDMKPVSSTHKKKDSAWKFCEALKSDGRIQIKCKYCFKIFKGGGIYRLKEHLAGRKSGGAPICGLVPPDVRLLMQHNLSEVQGKQKKKKSFVTELDNVASPRSDAETFANHYNDIKEDQEERTKGNLSGKKKRGRPRNTSIVNTDLVVIVPKVADNSIQMAVGRFLLDLGANLDAVNSMYFQQLIDAVASGVSGVVTPSHHDLHGWILKNLVEEVRNEVDQYKASWKRDGCSILVEEWKSKRGKTLLNFLVYCTQGTVFLRSVDASNLMESTDELFSLLKEVVEEVGAGNVLQVITKSDKHYAVAGRSLMDTFPSLYWAPCATHCIEMILKDFGKIEWIKEVIDQAKSVTRFIYNNSIVLNMMRKFTFGNDIVQQGESRSATDFATVKRMADFKLNLQTMVTSHEWVDCPCSKQSGGLAVLDIVSNRSFWTSCTQIIRLTNPLLRLLEIVRSEKRPAMGYVLSGIYQAKETIKKKLVKRTDYMLFWDIIHRRWELRHLPIHAAGFFLNPQIFYRIEGEMHSEIQSRTFDCIEKLVPDTEIQDKIVKELNLYKIAAGDLGRRMAVRSREKMHPAEWWSAYGIGCPNLNRLAVRILSQTCSSTVLKPNHIPLEKIYDSRNCLERQRLKDLVFVQYNLRLRQMIGENKGKLSVDPISFDNIDPVEEWISQNEPCVEDEESLDWMSLVPPSVDMMPSEFSADDTEDFSSGKSGFDDYEIFDGLKEVE